MCARVHDTYNIQYIFFILLSIKIIDHSHVLYRMYLFIVLVSECVAHVTTSTTLVSSTNYLKEVTIHHLLGWTLPNVLFNAYAIQYNAVQVQKYEIGNIFHHNISKYTCQILMLQDIRTSWHVQCNMYWIKFPFLSLLTYCTLKTYLTREKILHLLYLVGDSATYYTYFFLVNPCCLKKSIN